jgi:hypothetical protein
MTKQVQLPLFQDSATVPADLKTACSGSFVDNMWNNPFLAAVLAGVFTTGSLEQLRSLGFQVLYFPYETLIAAFASMRRHQMKHFVGAPSKS